MKMNHPSSSSSLSKQKTIYLWFQTLNSGGDGTEKKSTWYKLGPTEFNSPESDLTLVSETNLNRASEAVALNSTIYVLAGSGSNPSRQVFHFDTLRPDIGWKLGPALIWPRTDVNVTVKGGKINALGEAELKLSFEDRGEIIDPLLSASREEKTHTNDISNRADYYYSRSKVFSKGFYEVMGLDEEVRPPDKGLDYEHEAFLVDVGDGRLCLMWESDKGLHCTKFRVSVHSDGRFETVPFATVEAFRIFSKYERQLTNSLSCDAYRHWRYCLVL